jgi:hypothetical protein
MREWERSETFFHEFLQHGGYLAEALHHIGYVRLRDWGNLAAAESTF